MVDRCMWMDSSGCDPSRITLNLRSGVTTRGVLQPYGFLFIQDPGIKPMTYRT